MFVLLLSLLMGRLQAQTIRYVSTSGTNTNPATATSWATATPNLQGAINASQAGDQVWLAAGTYKPTAGSDRTISFAMKEGVGIYGGFRGNETSLSSRPPTSPSSTTLSGEIGDPASTADNAYHVIANPRGLTPTAVLDGFVITGGNANAGLVDIPNRSGGGVYNGGSGSGGVCSPSLRNCTFVGNRATFGGGMYNEGFFNGTSSPQLTNCSFQGNSAGSDGGGMYNEGEGGTSSPQLTNCSFQGNSANFGGGMYNRGVNGNASPQFTNCSFQANSANFGGGMYNEGEGGISSPQLTNCSFQANSARFDGGGMYNEGFFNGTSIPQLTNCSFQANQAGEDGGGMYNRGVNGNASPQLTNCVLWNNGGGNTFVNSGFGNSVTATYTLFDATVTGYSGNNNLTTATSPFVSASSVALNACAPAIDAGNDGANATSTDLVGNNRKLRTIDMGAIEFQGPSARVAITTQPPAGSAVCAGSTVTASVATSGPVSAYQWYKDGAVVGGQTVATLTLTGVTTANAGRYAVVVTGCNAVTSTAFSLTVNAQPSVSLSNNGPLTCSQPSVTLTASPASSGTYAFRGPGGAVPSSGNTATVSQAGTYTVTLTNTSGCAATATTTVSSDAAAPSVSISPATTAICAGQTATLTANASAGGSSLTYRWSTDATTTSISVAPTTTTPYSVTVTRADNGCAASASATVTVNPQPSVSLSNNGPLTCSQNSVTLTASPAGQGSYTFSGPGLTGQNGNQATAIASGIYSVTLTNGNGCSATASTTVESNTNLPAPSLQASASQTSGQPISVTASGCQGTLTWLPQGGTGQANGNIYTFTQPGNYTLSATCTVNACTSPSAAPLVLQIRPGGLAITSVSMVNCQLFDPAKGEYQVRFTPQYSGSNGQPITFAVVNELAPTTQPAPYQLRLYTDNSAITLVANQPGNNEARFTYNWLASCRTGTDPNNAPTTTGIPNQQIVEDQPYRLDLTSYFTDPDGQPLTYSAQGLPAGLTLSGSVIGGSPQDAGRSQVTVTALDPVGAQVSTSFSLSVSPASTTSAGFSITGVSLVSCQLTNAQSGEYQIRFNPQYSGLTGEPVSFSVANELAATTQPGPYSLRLYCDNARIGLVARQGSAQASFSYNWLAACQSGSGRLAAPEPGNRLRVTVLGNPVVNSTVAVEVRGAEGQPLRLTLSDASGRPVRERLVEQAGVVERVVLLIGHQPAGVLVLQVSTPTQSRTLKVVKVE